MLLVDSDAGRSSTLREFAPAKINLALHVTGRRSDGYHDVESLVVFADFGDVIEIASAQRDSFAISGPFGSSLLTDADNLVTRARDLLRATRPTLPMPPVALRLEKRLPVASGIGGGSADAAATLRGLDRHWRLDLTTGELAEIAAPLGADAPMCLASRPLFARGIGHHLEPLARFPRLHLVLVNPGVAISTPTVFRALARRENPPLPALPQDASLAGLLSWLEGTRNDLEPTARAIAPKIGEAVGILRDAGSQFSRMSGSGATCFGIFSSRSAAQKAAADILAARADWFVTATETLGGFDVAA